MEGITAKGLRGRALALCLGGAAILATTFGAAPTRAAPGPCRLSDPPTEAEKLDCVANAQIALSTPSLGRERIVRGPGFDPPSRSVSGLDWFPLDSDVLCYFRPHYAFRTLAGESVKFQCWLMTQDRRFLGADGVPFAVPGAHVVVKKNKRGERRARLVDSAGERQDDAQRIKVKYLRPPYPNHDRRYHEVFTEVAASRIMWVLGFPADHVYSVRGVGCVGCDENPFGRRFLWIFGRGQKENLASPTDTPRVFEYASVENEHPFEPIEATDEFWGWPDAARFYADGRWNQEQRVQYDAYRLALGLITYHNPAEQQNRVACDGKPSGTPRSCARPFIFVQDLGSTFGAPKNPLLFWTSNPRGDYGKWASQTVFADAGSCKLRHTLQGPPTVSREGQQLLRARLSGLDRATVRTIFQQARFDMMDQKQLARLRDSSADPRSAALEEWTTTFLERIQEVMNASGCPSLTGS